MHWVIILLGIIVLSLSISNPFYRLIFNNKINFNIFTKILFRFFLFFFGIILIFAGLFVESIS